MNHTPNHCYVEVWREANFRGESLRIYGPASHADLHFQDGDWANDIRSLRVGPHAFVMAYRGEKYQDAMHTFGPNDMVADLEEFKLGDEIDSLRLINSLKIFDRLYAVGEEQAHAEAKEADPAKDEKRRKRRGRKR